MLKKYWKQMTLSSVLLMVPALVRFDQGWLPWVVSLSALALHWLAMIITLRDPGNRAQSPKIMNLLFCLVPAATLICGRFLLWEDVQSMHFWLVVMISACFLVLGNYMPKVRPNYTFGIKVKWALKNEENWNATHRFTGKLWVVGGTVLLIGLWLEKSLVMGLMMAVLLVLAVAPVLYSYLYSRKQRENGTYEIKPLPKNLQRSSKAVWLGIIALCAILGVLLFSGDITMVCGSDALEIQADFWPGKTVAYADIDAIALRTDVDPGIRVAGFGTPKLLMGTFSNDEFGYYTRYSYTQAVTSIVLEIRGDVLVLGLEQGAETQALYEEILKHLQ